MPEVDVDRSHAVTPSQRWMQALHLDLVGRLPDPQNLAHWLTSARRGAGHREIAGELVRSDDYCRVQIAAVYRALLDRDDAPDERAAWTRSLGAGIALQDVIAGLCDGGEYKANHPVADAFVESLFQRLLHRASDRDGKAGWIAALDGRASTASVIRGVLCSTEYCAQRATELHERLLGRAPGEAELAEHVLALMHGAALQQLAVALVTSAEYIARAETRRAGREADDDVLAMIRDGHLRAALERLMQRHGRAVYRYCVVAIGDATLADDIQQQVFIEAFRDLPRFAGRSSLQTWLLGIARHRVLDAAKRVRRTRAQVGDAAALELPDPQPLAGDSLDDAERAAAVAVCIDRLEEPARTAVLLHYQQGLTYEDMAGLCGEKPGTLQARVARALHRLRAMVEEQLGRPEHRTAEPRLPGR